MKLNKTLLGLMVFASTHYVLAAKPAPVLDVSQSGGASVGSVAERLENLERQQQSSNRRQIELQSQLDELLNEVSELRGVTELHSHQLNQVLERQRELYQELDRRVSQALTAKPTQVPATIAAPNAGTASYSSNLTENEAYDRAVNMVLRNKQYDQAIPAFKEFNTNFPNSTYAPNAHYWLGQLLFNKNDLTGAAQEFGVVVNQYSDSNKRPDAMLKLAMVAQKQNQKAKAVQLYQQLISQYPDSTAAQLAQPRLESLQ